MSERDPQHDRRQRRLLVGLAILFFAAGAYYEWRPKHEDELEKVMFPRE